MYLLSYIPIPYDSTVSYLIGFLLFHSSAGEPCDPINFSASEFSPIGTLTIAVILYHAYFVAFRPEFT